MTPRRFSSNTSERPIFVIPFPGCTGGNVDPDVPAPPPLELANAGGRRCWFGAGPNERQKLTGVAHMC